MTTEFVKLEMKNNPATTAELTGYRDVICEYGEKGFSYAGYVPEIRTERKASGNRINFSEIKDNTITHKGF